MKLGPVTKFEKQGNIKNVWRWCYIGICDVIVIFRIYGQFEAIRKWESARIVCKTYIFFNSNLLSDKNWNRNESLTQLSY